MPAIKRQRTNSYGSYKRRGAFQFKGARPIRYSKIYQGVTGEKKFLETAVNLGVAATGGLIEDSINHVAQGTGESQRVGRQIKIHNVSLRGAFNYPEHATQSYDMCRFIVYLDTQCNGAAAAVTDILETADEHAFRNLANSKRFRILQDMHFAMNSLTADAASQYGGVFKQHEFFWESKKGVDIEYNSTAGAIGEIRSNNIGILWVNQLGNVAYEATCRIRYSDK